MSTPMSRAMPAFRILCRTAELSPHHHEARIFVLPDGEATVEMAVRSECRILSSAELAYSECMRMAESMRSRFAVRGWRIVEVAFGA
jgi:hypothetical protein